VLVELHLTGALGTALTEVGSLLLSLAIVGVISSTVYLLLVLAGVAKFRKEAARQKHEAAATTASDLPGVSILKPLHGMEVQLERNLESFFLQDYAGEFEIIFAVDRSEDAALPIAEKVSAKYPHVPSRILVVGEPIWPNPPAHAFSKMADIARHDLLVTSDSDVEVEAKYLSEIAPIFQDSTAGMLTCLYRGLSRGGIWSALDASGMSVEMTAGVLVANLLEGMKFGLGPTIAVRRRALDAIGGFKALGNYFSNDFVIGNLIAARGFRVVLSRHIISHIVPPMRFRKMWQRQVRWATGTRYSRPKGHFGTVFVFAIPYGMLGLLAGVLLRHPALGLDLFCVSVLNRVIEGYVIGWGVARDRECLEKAWLYPLRDLLGFAVWVASYLSRNMRWRDGRFELIQGGLIRTRDRVAVEQE
jgi:ceramide glucosyltransferase